MAQMANTAKAKSGTFVGTGSVSVALDIGFEPDVIVIDSGLDYTQAGWIGVISLTIVRGVLTVLYCHTGNTATNAQYYGYAIKSTDDPWATNTGSYRATASYSNGILTMVNATDVASQRYINGQTYSWKAYKL